MRKGADALRADGFAGEVKVLTSCPSCLQGLSRFDDDAGTKADYIVVEIAKRMLGAELDGRLRRARPTTAASSACWSELARVDCRSRITGRRSPSGTLRGDARATVPASTFARLGRPGELAAVQHAWRREDVLRRSAWRIDAVSHGSADARCGDTARRRRSAARAVAMSPDVGEGASSS